MPHISKGKIKKEVFIKIYEDFINKLSGNKNKSQVLSFSKNFFTPTEKVMLAKRLAIIVLLDKGFKYRDISEYLKVSQDTIGRYQKKMASGQLSGLIENINKKSKGESLAENIIRAFTPDLNKLIGKNRLPK